MDFDWIIEELKIQSAVCDFTEDSKKVSDIKRAIAVLEKESNVYRLPRVMNFSQIYHPPAKTTISVTGTTGTTNTVLGSWQTGTYVPPPPSGIPYSYGGTSVIPSPTASAVSINPSALVWDNNNPKPGDDIFAIFKDEDGNNRYCIYTWQQENNPEELYAYASGWDVNDRLDGTQKWMPCKKHKSEKFMVVCLNECCKQNHEKK